MSKYSGKCDLYDFLLGSTNEEDLDFSKIEIHQIADGSYFDKDGWHDIKTLDIKSIKELMPYYPYIVSIMLHKDNTTRLYIGKQSFVDQEEQERLQWYMDKAKSIYRSCRRRKIKFTKDQVYRKLLYGEQSKFWIDQIYERVKEHPTSAKIDGIHMPSYDRLYRTTLYNDMVQYGYSEEEAYAWCFGKDKRNV